MIMERAPVSEMLSLENLRLWTMSKIIVMLFKVIIREGVMRM